MQIDRNFCQQAGTVPAYTRLENGLVIRDATHVRPIVRKNERIHMTKLTLIVPITILTFMTACRESKVANANPAKMSSFHVGQAWTFRASAGVSTNESLTIVYIDSDSKIGPIIYVSFNGVGETNNWQKHFFCAFSEDALKRSVVACVSSNTFLNAEDFADFGTFYQISQQVAARGEVDKCWTITVAEVLEKEHNANK